MALPVQFQLGLELTNIVNPISQAISALGSLALMDAINKSGSDALTELKLASLIGKHRIDPVIKFHFREVVQKPEQSVISRYIDITLASGAGPTVQEALKNPALFSMVIQLSALAFAHQDESLAFATVEAIERIVEASRSENVSVPDYPSLLGTVRACQQQTAAFQWASLFEAVERKIEAAAANAQDSGTPAHVDETKIIPRGLPATEHASFTNRAIPFTAFQSLLMWLQTLQNFPRNRLLHLRCDTGISTIVVWCHHVLGLSVSVSLSNFTICFGGPPSNIIVTGSDADHAGASLMDPEMNSEPLFTLDGENNHIAVQMGSEHRVPAYGFGCEAFRYVGIAEAEWPFCTHWVMAHVLSPPTSSHLYPYPRETAHDHLIQLSKERLIHAGQFLFALDHVDEPLLDELIGTASTDVPLILRHNWQRLVALLYTFATIQQRDLHQCSDMPLSLTIYQRLNDEDDRLFYLMRPNASSHLWRSFNMLSHLLLGHYYSDAYAKPAVLISGLGWSIFFDVVDAVDPSGVSTDSIRVMRGVPARRGVRKMRIIDGPSEQRLSSQVTVAKLRVTKSLEITYFPGLSTASKGVSLVGQRDDAFQVTQNFEWCSLDGGKQTYRLGVREMQNSCLKARRLLPCHCTHTGRNFERWSESRAFGRAPHNFDQPNGGVRDADLEVYEDCWPDGDATRASNRERVFVGRSFVEIENNIHPPPKDAWFFYVTENPAARWLQLEHMTSYAFNDALHIRGRDTCFDCACKIRTLAWHNPLMVLL